MARSRQSSAVRSKNDTEDPARQNGHVHAHEHPHSHSFLGVHDHHDHEDRTDEAQNIVEALKGRGDTGSRVTLLGLAANIGLTAVKGLAGWYLNSAVLLADAGHSLSDLVGDFVTLFCYIYSQRPPSSSYPYGYGKFETLGTTVVSLFLLAGAFAIGIHSYNLLSLSLPAIFQLSPHIHSPIHSHSHSHLDDGNELDPNAAWFALLSIVTKEYLYRLTSSVAKEENSPVLLANALHHRSDMYSSFVSLVAILGSWALPNLPLDPIGGIFVTLLILHQSLSLLRSSFSELTDASVSHKITDTLQSALEKEDIYPPRQRSLLLGISDVRAIRRGRHLFVDVIVDVDMSIQGTLADALELEDVVESVVKKNRKDATEVKVTFRRGGVE